MSPAREAVKVAPLNAPQEHGLLLSMTRLPTLPASVSLSIVRYSDLISNKLFVY